MKEKVEGFHVTSPFWFGKTFCPDWYHLITYRFRVLSWQKSRIICALEIFSVGSTRYTNLYLSQLWSLMFSHVYITYSFFTSVDIYSHCFNLLQWKFGWYWFWKLLLFYWLCILLLYNHFTMIRAPIWVFTFCPKN